MKHYYDNLDDFQDSSPSRLMECWKRIMPMLIAVAAIVLMLMICAELEGIR